MPSIINVLIESFQLLRQRPRLFLPKIVSTTLGALWFVGLLSGTGSLYFYAATGPFLAFIGVFVSIMLAGMVKHRDADRILRKGWLETVGRTTQLLKVSAVLFLAALLLYIPLVLGAALYYVYGSYIALLTGVVLTGLLALLFAFLVYFFPISLIEEGSIVEGFRESAGTSMDNSVEVMFLTLLSFSLLALASMTGDQGMRYFGYAGFLSLRIVSGIVTTYIFVISPKYYLSG